ncbi:hypothetical protein [Pedobacter sp. ASV28]|uniref:hypothetical protein n=1 Tax=Pedobacter sp. ASV28 TaxID=2795123 RepID=UPI0018EAC3FB|nr:hypothetical protein [Pedobacter sp. ASV28]
MRAQKGKWVLIILVMIFLGCENFYLSESNIIKVTNRSKGIISDVLIVDDTKLLSIVNQHGRAEWNDSSGIASRNDTAFLVSTDNNGKVLKEQQLGINANWLIQKVDSSIYIMKYSKDRTSIYSLSENGDHLSLILNSPLYLRSIIKRENDLFICEGRLQYDDNYQLFEVSKKKYKILSPDIVDQAFSHGDEIFELARDSDSKSYIFQKLLKGEQKYSSQTILKYDRKILPKTVKVFDNQIFTLCQKADSAFLLIGDMKGKNEVVKVFGSENRIFPKIMHVFNHKIVIMVGERGTINVENHFFYSEDNGKSWTEIQLHNSHYSGPVAFYDNEKNKSIKCLLGVGDGKIEEFNF